MMNEGGDPLRRAVTADDLERHLERVRDLAAGEAAGVFGPDSLTWRVDREAALFLGAGRALLLQLAHPWVAAGIAEHSHTLTDPVGRFHRTFDIMFTLVFGSLDQALDAARRLHRRHEAVEGRLLLGAAGRFLPASPYWANEPAALQWVHATLVETAVIARDLVLLPPLTLDERERYYAESRVLGMLFGLPLEHQPPDWASFEAYMDGMWRSETLVPTAAAREVATQVLSGAGAWLQPPSWYRALTIRLLPDPARRLFDLGYGEDQIRRSEKALRWLSRIYPVLPERIRHVGPFQEATSRMAGWPGPDWITRGVNRLWIGRSAMRPAKCRERSRSGGVR